MKQKIKEKEKQPEKKKKSCNHFWQIEVANGPSSVGICKYCGKTKEFLNAFPAFNPLKKNSNPLALPKIPDVKIEKDSES